MVKFTKLKIAYSHCLMDFINIELSESKRKKAFKRMQAIEKEFQAKHNQKITITIATEEIKNGI